MNRQSGWLVSRQGECSESGAMLLLSITVGGRLMRQSAKCHSDRLVLSNKNLANETVLFFNGCSRCDGCKEGV